MKNLFRLVVFVLLITGWGLAATALHVVRTPGATSREFVIVPKNRIGITDTFVDTRAWTLDDASNHPGVVRRMIETEKYMALAHVTGESEPAEVQQRLADAAVRGPQPRIQATTTTTPVRRGGDREPEGKSSRRRSTGRRQVASR